MTTHAGRGANTAFQDCVMLAKTLQNANCTPSDKEWANVHHSYEVEMFTNGFAAMADSYQNTLRIHKADSTLMLHALWWLGHGTKLINYLSTGEYSILQLI